MSDVSDVVSKVTRNIRERSRGARENYLQLMESQQSQDSQRNKLSCGNLAHGFAACNSGDKDSIRLMDAVNIGIVTAFNDMLSAHQPYQSYPDKIKEYAREMGSTAQVAGGVPAMCDGVTQGMPGMELSLFSRDVIAQSTAISLSHQMFDGVVCLGICDKIVPGLLMGCLRFGHLPTLFIPSGPMPSGISNSEKAKVRQRYAEGSATREELLEAESSSYHSPGTCTFYGTANSNQVILEAMGIQLPGSSFVTPETSLREALTREAVHQLIRISSRTKEKKPLAEVVDERSIVNAVVALLASGGSTNHAIHLVAIARAAGFILNWDDFDELSRNVPLLARVYPNGLADVNHFQAAGGTTLLFKEMMDSGLMHADAKTVWGGDFSEYLLEPYLDNEALSWQVGVSKSLDSEVIGSVDKPFDDEGGLRLLKGNLGRAVIKVSAVAKEHRIISAPAIVIDSQDQLIELFKTGKLNRDCVVVVRFQGPRANGMPELHKLTPTLSSLQDNGYKVALVTDGRMSGASGKVPAAIHVTPEALNGGLLAHLQDGDVITLDAEQGLLTCELSEKVLLERSPVTPSVDSSQGVGRELFGNFRSIVTSAEEGASVL